MSETIEGYIYGRVHDEAGRTWGITGEEWPMGVALFDGGGYNPTDVRVKSLATGDHWTVPMSNVEITLRHGLFGTATDGTTIYVVDGGWGNIDSQKTKPRYFGYLISRDDSTDHGWVVEREMEMNYTAFQYLEAQSVSFEGLNQKGHNIERAIHNWRVERAQSNYGIPPADAPDYTAPTPAARHFVGGDRVNVAPNSRWNSGTPSGLKHGKATVTRGPDTSGDILIEMDEADEHGRRSGYVGPAYLSLVTDDPEPKTIRQGDKVIVATNSKWVSGRASHLKPGVAVVLSEEDSGGDVYVKSEMPDEQPGASHGHVDPQYLSPAIEKTGSVEDWEPVSDIPLGTVAELQERVERLTTLLTEQTRRADAARSEAVNLHGAHQDWKDNLTSEAHRYANDQSWCEEFDDFMERHGLDRRNREFSVTVQVTGTVEVTVTASDEDSAREMAEEQAGDEIDHDFEIDNTEVINIEGN